MLVYMWPCLLLISPYLCVLIRHLLFSVCRQLECVLCIHCTSVQSKYYMQSRKTENIKYYESDISCWCEVVGKWRMETMTPRSMELFVTHDHAAKEQADSQLTWLQLEEHPAWLSRGTLLRGSCTL
ncbi:uncharacterized protein [Triticum aestivum]|uniref:uncharacterized protein n=1 Tax=Triticum aestivum TaxID=4565 RepID=UPI001D00CC7A|nr:uncharacterized protein LOC123077079 [Triticum aestivum]